MKNRIFFSKKAICISVLIALFFIVGCVDPNVKQTTTDYIINNSGAKIQIIEIDSCEYLFYRSGHQAAMAHKGNCKYCKKRALNNK